MKKIYLLSGASVIMALSSCVKDGTYENNFTLPSPAISIITDLNTNEVTAVPGIYRFNVKFSDSGNSAYVSSPENDLIVNNTNLAFSTEPQAYTTSTGFDYFLKDAKATVGNYGWEINNANFLSANPINEDQGIKYGYYFDVEPIGQYTFNPQYQNIAIAKYNIGDYYRVNTFPVESFFKGATTLSYSFAGVQKEYVNEEIAYRFSINFDKESKEFKANLILYNARFAEEMPMALTAVLVEGLDVEFTSSGVKISGSDIIPSYFTNSQYLEMERYIFKSINFETTDSSYTFGKIDYQVGNDYFGHFEGSYAKLYNTI